jgi:excinuclease UvrABC ATPase subunit
MLTVAAHAATTCKNVTAEIPLGLMTCITGVSGSGKSTLDQRHAVSAGGAPKLNGATLR